LKNAHDDDDDDYDEGNHHTIYNSVLT